MPSTSTNLFSRILLATDGSPSSQQATEVTAQIAKALSSEVTVLNVIPSISSIAAPLEGDFYSRLIDEADENVEKATATLKREGVVVLSAKETPQSKGSVAETILQYAVQGKTGLIIMGTRGLGGFKRLALGSVSSEVALHAPCSTLVVRSKTTIRRILVATDGSKNAQRALEAAVGIAIGLKAELRIVHVAYVPAGVGIPGSTIPIDKMEEDAEKLGKDLLSKAVNYTKDSGIPNPLGEVAVEFGSPAWRVIQIAEKSDADVIVVGTRGLGGFKKLIMGSFANSVLHYAHCSVLVVK